MTEQIPGRLYSRENNFDFLRFICALLVIFSHAYIITFNRESEPLYKFSKGNLALGELAVVAFFVISGFLITMSYHRSVSLKHFLAARGLRIYPALVVVILCTVFVIGPVLTSLPLTSYLTDRATGRYLINITSIKMAFRLPGVFTGNTFPADSINGSLWTLPHELFCYLAVACTGLLLKRRLKFLPLLLLPLVVIGYFADHFPLLRNTFYFSTGAAFYFYRDKGKLSGFFALLCALLFMVNIRYNPEELSRTAIAGMMFGYIVIYLSFMKSNRFVTEFAKKGDYSYGLYIWAFPVQQMFIFYTGSYNYYFNFIVSSVITLALSILSWHFIERNALKLKKRVV